MFRFNWTKTLAAAALVTATVFSASTADAGGYHGRSRHDCYYKTVTTHKTVTKPVVKYVTKYTSCGHPYRAKVVKHVSVTVPVTKQVRVCH